MVHTNVMVVLSQTPILWRFVVFICGALSEIRYSMVERHRVSYQSGSVVVALQGYLVSQQAAPLVLERGVGRFCHSCNP